MPKVVQRDAIKSMVVIFVEIEPGSGTFVTTSGYRKVVFELFSVSTEGIIVVASDMSFCNFYQFVFSNTLDSLRHAQ